MEALPNLQQVEIVRLAKDVLPGHYIELCVALGYSINHGDAVLASHQSKYKEATTQVLNDWNTKQIERNQIRSNLARKLKEAELGELGTKLSTGEYLQSEDGMSNQGAVPGDSDIYSEKISESLTVRRCRTILEERYSTELCKIQMKPWDKNDYAEFQEMHTVVTMVKKDSHGEDTKKKEILQGSAGKIFSEKVNGRFPSRILISAPAGRGKTTAVAKMAHDWVHREHGSGLEDLPLLFIVKFRNTSQSTSIGEAIISELLSDVDDLTPEGLERFIRQHQGICHIVLDGLDEYAGISSTSNILSILRWKMFLHCRVLVTTRPHLDDFFSQGDLPRVYTKMVIEGFSRESSRDYIDKFFTSINKPMSSMSADDLKVYLDEQPLIDELVKTPLFCLMVCHLWSEGLLQSETTTQTALLDKVNLFLMHHANARSPGLIKSPKHLTKVILKLGEVALTSLLNDSKKLVFTSRDFQRIPSILKMACDLGIMSKTVVSLGGLPETNETSLTTFEFYHKLAQEHAAGKFLADKTNSFMFALKISKIDRVLRKINRNIGEYEHLIRFAAGTKNTLCVRIMEKLLTNGHLSESERYRILLDCSSESGVNVGNVSSLIRRCVTAQTMILKSPTIYTAVGMRNLPSELKHKVVHVQFEESILASTVTDGLWSCLKSYPELRYLTISDSSLAFSSSPPDLPSVIKLSAVKLTSKNYEGLISSLPCVEDIDITMDDVERDIFHITAGLHRTGGQKLTSIYLHGPTSLSSERRRVSRETMRGLGQVIKEHTQNLQELYLEWVKCTEDGLVYLIDCCRHVKAMKYVNFVYCGTTSSGRLDSHLNQLRYGSSDGLDVDVNHDDIGNYRYFIPHFISWSHKT